MLSKIGISPPDEKLHLLLISTDGEATEVYKFSAFHTVPQYNTKCSIFFESVLKMVFQSYAEPIYLSYRFANSQGESGRAAGVKEFRLFPKISS